VRALIAAPRHADHQCAGLPLLQQTADLGEARRPFAANHRERMRVARFQVADGDADAAQAIVEGEHRAAWRESRSECGGAGICG